MAYVSQERKRLLAHEAKKVLTKYGVKATFGVHHNSTLVCNIRSGKIDFISNYNDCAQPNFRGEVHKAVGHIDVNPYHFKKEFGGIALECMKELFAALNAGNHDNSDIQTDYFDVGWYVDVNIGKYDKPYVVE